MGTLVRNTVLVVWVWLMLAGVCLGKQVYLRDGGIVECQSVWQRGNLIVVKINRDTVVEFARSEVDLRRTHLGSGKKPHRPGHKKARTLVHSPGAVKPADAAGTVPAPVTPPGSSATPAAKLAQPVKPVPVAVAKPAQPSPAPVVVPPPAPTPAPAAKEEARPEPAAQASSEPPAPQSKEEADKVRKQAAEMMAEAIQKKDPEMMKKAVELQKSTLPQNKAQAGGPAGVPGKGMSVTFLLLVLVVSLLIVVSLWVVFEKCGEAGWKCLIPFYNMYVLMVICEKPVWWFLLLFIPMVGTVFYLLAMLALAERFGRGPLFGIGLTFLPMIFFPLLAFGGSKPEEFTFA